MDLKEFAKKKWGHSEEIEYRPPSLDGVIISCMLNAVDFEQELFRLTPFDTELYENKPFWVRVD